MKKERLYKQITLLLKCQTVLIDTELHNIKKLKQKKCMQIKMSVLSTDSSQIVRDKSFNLILTSVN